MENKPKAWSVLSKIDCSSKVEKKKQGNTELSYLSWAWAWAICKEHFPDASWDTIDFDGKPFLHDPILGYLVATTVTIEGETLPMRLPVLDGANKAMKSESWEYDVIEYKDGRRTGGFIKKKVDSATFFDVNTAIMRCFVKNLSLFGLGINLYAGEDLPLSFEDPTPPAPQPVACNEEQRKAIVVALKDCTGKGVVLPNWDGTYKEVGNQLGFVVDNVYYLLPTANAKPLLDGLKFFIKP